MFKKVWLFLLAAVLLLNLAACGKNQSSQADSQPKEELVTDPITLINNNSIVLRVLKIEPENEAGYTVSVMVWNQTDKEFSFFFDDFAVNDLLYGDNFQFTVAAGQKQLKRITLTPHRMQFLGLEKVTKIDFRFYGIRPDYAYQGIFFEEKAAFFPLGESAYKTHHRTPAKTDIPLIDNEYCTVTLVESYAGEADFTYTLYVANKTDKNLLLVAKGLTLNGQPCDLHTEIRIQAGKQNYDTVTLSHYSLEAYNITSIESFSADIGIYDVDHYADGPLTTVPVSIS